MRTVNHRGAQSVHMLPVRSVSLQSGLTSISQDDRAGFEPDCLLELHAIVGQQLWGDAAQSSQHGPSGMNDLNAAVSAAKNM